MIFSTTKISTIAFDDCEKCFLIKIEIFNNCQEKARKLFINYIENFCSSFVQYPFSEQTELDLPSLTVLCRSAISINRTVLDETRLTFEKRVQGVRERGRENLTRLRSKSQEILGFS